MQRTTDCGICKFQRTILFVSERGLTICSAYPKTHYVEEQGWPPHGITTTSNSSLTTFKKPFSENHLVGGRGEVSQND